MSAWRRYLGEMVLGLVMAAVLAALIILAARPVDFVYQGF